MNQTRTMSTTDNDNKQWIRGVNIGGWLVMERYIIPYQFAVTDCHLSGDLCWYPGAISAPSQDDPNYKLCHLEKCSPYRTKVMGGKSFDYPIDEWTLAEAFSKNRTAGEEWFNYHFNNFLTKDDIIQAKKDGVTHLRVPLPHWILGNVVEGEPWIVGDRWKAFLRLCGWARELGMEVWPNLHTAPGSQNGFDNSGVENSVFTCGGWNDDSSNIERTVQVIDEITSRIASDGLLDVITGFGLLNEPFQDCNTTKYRKFLDDGLAVARSNMGDEVNIFVSDEFYAPAFNDGEWWLEEKNTYLDTHFYHMFDPGLRSADPVTHMNLVCEPDDPQFSMDSCCYQDAPMNTTVSKGVKRVSTEWSVAFDSHPGELLSVVMQGIFTIGIAPDFHRVMEEPRKDFLYKFAQAQMVAYERADIPGLSDGWFYWTLKMEGGAFAEWDFTRGVREGYLPKLAPANLPSQEVYGTCEDIKQRTVNNTDIVHPYPWIDEPYWRDGVWPPSVHLPPQNMSQLSPQNNTHQSGKQQQQQATTSSATQQSKEHGYPIWIYVGAIILALYVIRSMIALLNKYFGPQQRKKNEYTVISDGKIYQSDTASETSDITLTV